MPPEAPPRLSIVVPVLNEADAIEETLDKATQAAAQNDFPIEILVADGGSTDGTAESLAKREDIFLVRGVRGRAEQMNAGAETARAPWIMFLHADTHLTAEAMGALVPRLSDDARTVYAFMLGFRGERPHFRRLERAVAWRCRALGLAYGDQALCMHRDTFRAMGGFRASVAMEDLDFVLRLRSYGRLEVLPQRVLTSTRQWDRQGPIAGSARNVTRLLGGLAAFYLRGAKRRGAPVESPQSGGTR